MSIRKLVRGFNKTPDEIEFDYIIEGISDVKNIGKDIYSGKLGDKSYVMFKLKYERLVSEANELIINDLIKGSDGVVELMIENSRNKMVSFVFGDEKVKIELRNEDADSSLMEIKEMLNERKST